MRRVPWAPSLLALALAPKLAAAVVEAFNCTRAGTQPFQLLKATGDDYYSLMRLDDGVYVDIFDLDYTDANDINAAAMYTDADGSFYPYAVFDSQLCRFDRYSVHCYDGTMGVDLANAAAIVGGDRRPTGAHRRHFERRTRVQNTKVALPRRLLLLQQRARREGGRRPLVRVGPRRLPSHLPRPHAAREQRPLLLDRRRLCARDGGFGLRRHHR
jgi:hypothetical protein